MDVGDGWTDTVEDKQELGADEVLDLDDEESKAQVVDGGDDDVEEVVDLDDLEGDGGDNIFASDKFVSNEASASGVKLNEKLRKYDLSITYDYYH